MQHHTCELQVLNSIHQRASHEELRAEVVDELWVLLTAQTRHTSMRSVTRELRLLHMLPLSANPESL